MGLSNPRLHAGFLKTSGPKVCTTNEISIAVRQDPREGTQLMPETASIKLPPSLGIAAADRLARDVAAHRGSALVLDGSEVEHLGGQCLQVLMAAQAAWAADGQAMTIADASPGLRTDLALLGALACFVIDEGAG